MNIQKEKIILLLALTLLLGVPFLASAAPSAGTTPDSPFYFLDTFFEKVALTFTFDSEKKAERALSYAEERLAEAGALAEKNKSEDIEKAVKGYQANITLALEESEKSADQQQKEAILSKVSESTNAHQETLSGVLETVPEEAKEAITRALEASRQNYEKAQKEIVALKQEVKRLKEEAEQLEKEQKNQKAISQTEKLLGQTQEQPSLETEETDPEPEIENRVTVEQEEKQEDKGREGEEVATTAQITQQTSSENDIDNNVTKPVEITYSSVSTDVHSARVELRTNKPAESKLFLSGDGFSSKVYWSNSGKSTYHIIDILELNSNTSYSYHTESVLGENVARSRGSFTTKPDEYTISLKPDKTSIPASGWHSILIQAQALKNGEPQSHEEITMTTPDSTQNEVRTTNTKTARANDWRTGFTYRPKTVDTHTLEFSWNGVSKTVDIGATEYIEVDPVLKNVINSDCIPDCSSEPIFEVASTNKQTIGSFEIFHPEEPLSLSGYKYDSDIENKEFLEIVPFGELYKIRVRPKTGLYTLPPGIHTVTIKEITVLAEKSASYKKVGGLPVTFTFKVKDVPDPEVLPIKTSHTYPGGRHPGVIGLFKISMKPDSSIKVFCESVQMIGNSDKYSAYIYAETPDGRKPQCPESWFGGGSKIKENATNSNGVSTVQFSLWVQDLTPSSDKMEFRINKLKVRDQKTGITRSAESPTFILEIGN